MMNNNNTFTAYTLTFHWTAFSKKSGLVVGTSARTVGVYSSSDRALKAITPQMQDFFDSWGFNGKTLCVEALNEHHQAVYANAVETIHISAEIKPYLLDDEPPARNKCNPNLLLDAVAALYAHNPVQHISPRQLTGSEYLAVMEYINEVGRTNINIDLMNEYLYRHQFKSTIFIIEEVEDRCGNINYTFVELVAE